MVSGSASAQETGGGGSGPGGVIIIAISGDGGNEDPKPIVPLPVETHGLRKTFLLNKQL